MAKIDGEYYQFDATWDAGVPPELYSFFGVSSETLQSYYPRLIRGYADEYCPPCTEDLPLPGGSKPISEELSPGTVENGVYSQPFWDLQLTVEDSWKVYSREEIQATFYGNNDLSMEKLLRVGSFYLDLMLERSDGTVQVMLERSPVVTGDGRQCSSPADYMDAVLETVPAQLEAQNLTCTESGRIQRQICGRSYEGVSVTAAAGAASINQLILCTERDGFFLTIIISAVGADQSEAILQKLLAGQGA